MKKIVLTLLIFCGWISVAFGGMVIQSVSSGGASQLYTDAISIWDFDNDATDTKGSHNLTARGDPTYSSGDKMQGTHSADLDGVGDSFDTNGDVADFDPGGDFAVAFWVKVDVGASHGFIDKFEYSSEGNGWQYGQNWSVFYQPMAFYLNNWSEDEDFWSNTIATDTWYHMMFSFDDSANTITAWISAGSFGSELNGITVAQALTPGNNSNSLCIGDNTDYLSDELDGHMDEVVYWSRTIDAAEAESVYDGSWR